MRNGEAKNLDDLIPRNWTVTVAIPGDAIDMYVRTSKLILQPEAQK